MSEFFKAQGTYKKGNIMAISSIHIEAGADGFFAHNSRETKTKNSIFNDEENFTSCTNSEAFKIYKDELKIRSAAYTKRTNQRLQKKAITHLSAIVNLNAEHTDKDVKKVCDYLQQTLDTKIIQFAIHRDEGHHLNEATDQVRKLHALLNEDDKIKNYHAHIEFMGLDSQGNSVRKKLTKKFLSNLQTKTAELLAMERGNYSMIDNPQEFYNKILREMPETNTLQEFKTEYIKTSKKIKYRDKPKTKRKSTQHYKDYKEHQVLAKQKDLKVEIARLRAELKNNKATREQYAQLEQLNRDLKEKIKNKNLTIENMKESLINERETILNQKCKIITLKQEKTVLEQTMDDLATLNILVDFALLSAQQKIFYHTYKKRIDDNINLKGYFIASDDTTDITTFVNKSKNLKIIDKGDVLIAKSGTTDLQEQVKVMIEIFKAKNIDLNNITVTGTPDFKREALRQLNETIENENMLLQKANREYLELQELREQERLSSHNNLFKNKDMLDLVSGVKRKELKELLNNTTTAIEKGKQFLKNNQQIKSTENQNLNEVVKPFNF